MNIWNKINDFLDKDKNVLFFSFLFLLIFSLPLLLLGGDVPYDVWDNLDSNVVWRKLMIDNQMIFADTYATVPQMMSGVPRLSLGSDLNLFILLAKVFSPVESLAVNRFLQIMVGFIGMFLLCRKYITRSSNAFPSAVVAILFAILPFWSSGCLSIAAQPLVLFSFLKIRDGKNNAWDWLVLAVYPFVSSFIVFGFFFYCILFAVFCCDRYKNKKINWGLFLALAVLSVFSSVIMYREISSFFVNTDFVSHRTEMEMNQAVLSLRRALIQTVKLLSYGHNHAQSNHFLILWFSLIAGIYSAFRYKKLNRKILFILLSIVLISFYSNIICWKPIHSIIRSISLFRMFNIDRFYTLFPLLMFICLAFVFNEIYKNKFSKIIFILLFFVQLAYSTAHDFTCKGLIGRRIFHKENAKTVTFNEYYSAALFQDIQQYIGKPVSSYRVAALGIHPSQLLYNGFYSVDGYCANYDVQYKHRFGDLIRGELDKNKDLQIYFDTWGNRCYLFDDELGKFGSFRADKTETTSLDINCNILKSMNCQYIISSAKIADSGEHLELQSVFENKIWKIYLYEVI